MQLFILSRYTYILLVDTVVLKRRRNSPGWIESAEEKVYALLLVVQSRKGKPT
jgi:hypothetical protein